MFSYYGSKSKIVNHYPRPKESSIIEPFAGSARYSLKYFDKEVTICDKYDKIIRIWRYLQQASKNDILSLPDVEYKTDITKFTQLSEEERWLMSYNVVRGSVRPDKRIVQKFCDWNNRDRLRIANDIFKIKHWKIIQLDYEDIPNNKATWFIDPPYEKGGEIYHYGSKKIDYDKLGGWCKNRNGHIIVCENDKAKWLPFSKMICMQGQKLKSTEVIWTNYKTSYNQTQMKINFDLKN